MTSHFADLNVQSLADVALDAAADAEHVDVRVMSTRTGYQTFRDTTPVADVDHTSTAVGVRVLSGGSWGFSATTDLTPKAVEAATRQARSMSKVAAPAVTAAVRLAPEPSHTGTWQSSYQVDPFDVSSTDRMQFLAQGCADLIGDDRVDRASASTMAVREETAYADNSGTFVSQRRVRVQGEFTGIKVNPDGSFETLRTTAPPTGQGWEYFQSPSTAATIPWDWTDELAQLPGRLAEKAVAPSIEPDQYTLVIDPTNLWLTIHESIGHATELDRARGYEANYAGTSFATEDQLGRLKYGSPLLNVTGDRTTPNGLATVAWDDEGVAAQEWSLISDGILSDYQLDRSMAGSLDRRSNGCAYADSGLHVPLQRMPNVSLSPDPHGGSLADLIGGVSDGIYVVGDNSWSIDMQRYNFQFTGQRFERIKNGRLVGQVKDVAYQGSTPSFWGQLSALGGPETYLLGGAFNCGKGQPGQAAPVSHGCPAAVFDRVNVLNSVQEGKA